MAIRGIIFDLDGTLADTLPDLADAVNLGLRRFGFPQRDTTDIGLWIGDGLPMLCRRAICGSETISEPLPDEATLQSLTLVISEHYARHRLDKTRPYDGMTQVLDALAARAIHTAVLSNKPHEHTPPMVEALFGRRPWVAVEGYRDEKNRKPDPRGAQAILSKMGIAPDEAAMVGDSCIDLDTARNTGMVAVAVTWGYRPRAELAAARPDYLLDHPADLLTCGLLPSK